MVPDWAAALEGSRIARGARALVVVGMESKVLCVVGTKGISTDVSPAEVAVGASTRVRILVPTMERTSPTVVM